MLSLWAPAACKVWLFPGSSCNWTQISTSQSLSGTRPLAVFGPEEKVYTALSTNNLRRTCEYTDFPMDDSLGVKKDEHIPGKCIHEYLEQYARKFELKRRIQFHTEVNVVEKRQNGWNLQLENVTSKGHMSNGGNKAALPVPAQWNISRAKLIIATGLTSIPKPIISKVARTLQDPLSTSRTIPVRLPKSKRMTPSKM